MKFIELNQHFYNIDHIVSIKKKQSHPCNNFYYGRIVVKFYLILGKSPLIIEYDELSPSAKQFVDKVLRSNELEDDVDSKYKNLETKCDEILEAIKYLPVVSGDYNNAKTHFETQQF